MNTLTNSKILITGATDFIGSYLAEICIENVLDFSVFDYYNLSNPDVGVVSNIVTERF
jgi:nucleoside-diphosphate-sugar epimerase